MKHFADFKPSGVSFSERRGGPSEFDAAIGQITLSFAFLEDSLRNVIGLLLGNEKEVVSIVTAELSFRNKVDLIGSLVRFRIPTLPDIDDLRDAMEWFEELIKLCRRAEELRNKYLHSSYLENKRVKTTSKAKKGLHTIEENVDPGLLLDVADYIAYTGMMVEGSPLNLGIADQVDTRESTVTYLKNGKVVASLWSSSA